MAKEQETTNEQEMTELQETMHHHRFSVDCPIPKDFHRIPLLYLKELRHQIGDLQHQLWLAQEYCRQQGLTFPHHSSNFSDQKDLHLIAQLNSL